MLSGDEHPAYALDEHFETWEAGDRVPRAPVVCFCFLWRGFPHTHTDGSGSHVVSSACIYLCEPMGHYDDQKAATPM